jgi:hypothetical protein
MNNSTYVEFKVQALFGGPLISEFLVKTFQCINGLLLDSDAPPVYVEIINPVADSTIAGIASTEFFAIAWDPVIGATNGDGIVSVSFELIHESTGTLIMTNTDFTTQYCAFGGDSPCNRWQSPPVNPSWNWSNAPNGAYKLRARAVSTISGRVSDWVEHRFSVAKPLATSTPTPSPQIILELLVPVNGAVITLQSQTAFEAQAWDTLVGTWNGAGIEGGGSVIFIITNSSGTQILNTSQGAVKFCAFTGTGSCNTWTAPPATVSWAALPNGTYTIQARAFAPDGRFSAWDVHTFTISKPATATPTATPTPTP